MKNESAPKPIRKWVWQAYLKSALIPIIIIELMFFCINFSAHGINLHNMILYMTSQVQDQLTRSSKQEAANIEQQLESIKYLTRLYAKQTAKALSEPSEMSEQDACRLAYSPEGVYYTEEDRSDGGAAVFYSGIVPVGESQRGKVAKALQTQFLMKDIYESDPVIASIYLNTYDSLNVIYPYFDVISQYAPLADIPAYDFYYEADRQHNPERGVKWTDVHLDPAGHGWMASSVAPIYNGEFLAGVVGIDISVDTITEQIINHDIPWDGYAMLVGNDGTILALPEQGESDWGLRELTEYHYAEVINEDAFKPDAFNLNHMKAISGFSDRVATNENGLMDLTLNGEGKVASWQTIDSTGWKLIFIVPQKSIYAGIEQIRGSEIRSGIIIICSLLVFYSLFFYMLYKRSRNMSLKISEPLLAINHMVKRIGDGDYFQEARDFQVVELSETSEHLIDMGEQLGTTNQALLCTQEILKENEAYLQALVNSIDDVILEVDEHGYFKNIRTSDPSNLTVNYLEGQEHSIYTIMDTETAKAYFEKMKKVVAGGKPEKIEYQLETLRGMRWFQARIALIKNGSGTVAVSARDITDRKELERSMIEAKIEAEKVSQAKSQFLSNMSHELRTPLNAVLGFAQVLEIDPDAPLTESQQECVDEIRKAGGHLLDLINEILDLTKIESGRTSISIEPVKVSQIMDETLALVKPMADKYGIQLMNNYKQCSRYVKADLIRIKQILINLLSNAIKYNKEDGTVSIYCEPHGDNIRFHVVDNGIGIPKAELKEIFKPFYRISTTKNIVEGTGIGLAMVKQLVTMMGGDVYVESEVGKGSHFYIELPMADIDKAVMIKSEADIHVMCLPHHSKHRLLLYVEDNPANLTLVERILKHIPGVVMISAPSAEIGIDLARAHKPDLILLDINLPGMNGYEMLKRLQGFAETAAIPVVAISANAMEKDIQRAIKMGFSDYLTKPINVRNFLEKIRKFLSDS